ncbi:KpsF/GutQ family sugar-phosphate isomerase [Leeia oryzae]|uniref:KpsF/GutQ family sugar-phosphate isomerase n=1 Tax=Leeia oryzae TaxID=356662 RepID=UPI00037664CE|nr:KpsF/GutQ family sugar-phosphate isomerase [Leeia oryzae]
MNDFSELQLSAETLLARGRQVLKTESDAIAAMMSRLDETFVSAIKVLLACKGRVVVSGMGKSGHIGNKIAATLASTGTPAFFLHPAEACHGDLGMLQQGDVLIALSNSGESDEILSILPYVKRQVIPVIALTSNVKSSLGRAADVHLDVSVAYEACPLGLAPTSSTTAALAMGDALAVTLLDVKGFGAEDFALTHPSGRLGRRLLMRVSDVMHRGDDLPVVGLKTSLPEALDVITRKRLGFAAVLDEQNNLVGVFTDGDLRRAFGKFGDLRQVSIEEAMSKTPRSIAADRLAVDAFELMESAKITVLLVLDEQQHLVGAIHMHDLLQAGIV